MRRVRVAVPVPALEALSYRLPDDFADAPIGARVLVPLGTRVLTGVVVAPDPTPEPAATTDASVAPIRDVIDVLDPEPYLPADVVSLALWVAEYYASGAGDAVEAAMPPRAL